LPAGLTSEAVNHGQAQSGALTGRLGGKERVERARQHFGRHARSRVGHANRNVLARFHVALARASLVNPGVRSLDGESPAIAHRIAGVDTEIEYRVLELVRVA